MQDWLDTESPRYKQRASNKSIAEGLEPTLDHHLSGKDLSANGERTMININELVSQFNTSDSPSLVWSSLINLYKLSQYLFLKRFKSSNGPTSEISLGSSPTTDRTEVDSTVFDHYLHGVHEEFTIYNRSRRFPGSLSGEIDLDDFDEQDTYSSHPEPRQNKVFKTKSFSSHIDSELLKCFEKVPYIYFEENFFIDFSSLEQISVQDLKRPQLKPLAPLVKEQDILNDRLDSVEVNLFTQIHKKFHEYFRVMANLDYQRASITDQLIKLQSARKNLALVKSTFVDKTVLLRAKINRKYKLEKVVQTVKLIKSIKKLPDIVQGILQSSLPYQCLSLLSQIKKSCRTIEGLQCVQGIMSNLKSSETVAQIGLSKKYMDEIYLYIQYCFDENTRRLPQQWGRVHANSVLDKDCSTLNASINQDDSVNADRSGFLLEDMSLVDDTIQSTNREGGSWSLNSFARRDEAKELQISMILLQSYQFLSFPSDALRLKIVNSVRIFTKRYEKELCKYLRRVVKTEKEHLESKRQESGRNSSDQSSSEQDDQDEANQSSHGMSQNGSSQCINRDNEEQDSLLNQRVVEPVSVEFYVKHIKVLNSIFKEMVNRFLGFLKTLMTQYEEQLARNVQACTSDDDFKLIAQKHKKFRKLFEETVTLLPSLFKVMEDKLKYFMALKNISSVSPGKFCAWASIFRYWQLYFDNLGENSEVANFEARNVACMLGGSRFMNETNEFIDQIVGLVHDALNRSTYAFHPKGFAAFIEEITLNYIHSYHTNILNSELVAIFNEEPWQSVEIPSQFSQLLQQILVGEQLVNANISITILDSSVLEVDMMPAAEVAPAQPFSEQMKFKILKNSIMVESKRYKITMSFLLLCEIIDDILRMGRPLSHLVSRDDGAKSPRIVAHLYEKIYELILRYAQMAKEGILDTKALKMEKFIEKNVKSITVRHICLLLNCITLIQKLMSEIPSKETTIRLQLDSQKQKVLATLQKIEKDSLAKLSSILICKLETIFKNYFTAQPNTQNLSQLIGQTNNQLAELMLQVLEIISEFLSEQLCGQVFNPPFNLFVNSYLKVLLQQGAKVKGEVQLLIEKIRFLKKYFPQVFASVESEVLQ